MNLQRNNKQRPARSGFSIGAGRVGRCVFSGKLPWSVLLLLLVLSFAACRPQPTPTVSPRPTASPTAPASPISTVLQQPADAANTVYLPSVETGMELPSTPTATPGTITLATATATTVPPPPSPTPLPPAVFKPGWGLQVHLFGVDLDQTLSWAEGTGVEWLKQQVEWTNIEQAPREYDWYELDRIVNKVNEYGFNLMLSVNHAPAWTRTDSLEYGPPHDPAEFGRFMRTLAARYAGRVKAYELWNEPNLQREWHGEPLDPALFVKLVREGAGNIRVVDPNAKIISGAPAVTGINDGETAVDDRVYLHGMVAAGVGEWVDGIGVHPYGFANPPEERSDNTTHQAPSHNDHPSFFFRDTLEDYRAILVDGGLESLPLWVTEFGWPSIDGLGSVDTTGWEYARDITEAQQADYVVRGFQMGQALEWMGPMVLWNLNIATIWGKERPESAYSLLRPDGSYRPAYIAVRVAEPQ